MSLKTAGQQTTSRMTQQRRGREKAGRSSALQARRPGLFSAARIAFLRLGRSKGLLLAVGLGILVAVTVVSTVPLYSALIMSVELQRTFQSSDPSARNVESEASITPISTRARDAANATESQLTQQYLGDISHTPVTSYVASDAILVLAAGTKTFDPSSSNSVEASVQAWDYGQIKSHMQMVSGRLPSPFSGSGLPQVLATTEEQHEFHLNLGDTLVIAAFGNHTVQQKYSVVGFWQPIDASDLFWNGARFVTSENDNPRIYPLLVDQSTFYATLPTFASIGMTQHWIHYTDPRLITTATMAGVTIRVGAFKSHVASDLHTIPGATQAQALSGIDTILSGVAGEQTLLELPLYVIVAQVVGLALLFVATMAGLLVSSQSQEVATLKSRGASSRQVLGVYTTLAFIVAAISAMVGPFIASWLAHTLLTTLVPASTLVSTGVPASYYDSLTPPGLAALPAALAALLGVITVALAAWSSARLEVLAFRREQGRPTRAPLWQRLYLDVALGVICALGYVELSAFGGTTTRLAIGGAASPLLLVAPALLLLSGGLLVVRFLPLAARLLGRMVNRRRGLPGMLAVAQVERQPARYGRTAVLLVLALGLGIFALSFNASLVQNAHDRAAYEAGSSLRLRTLLNEGTVSDERIKNLFMQQPGVLAVSPLMRTTASSASDNNVQSDLLGIDPATFEKVAGPVSWRSDYAPVTLHAALSELVSQSGDKSAPLPALVSAQFAGKYAVHRGDTFALQLNQGALGVTTFKAVEIVSEFPTLYPFNAEGSYVIAGLDDLRAAIIAGGTPDPNLVGPNEYWVRTQGSASSVAAKVKSDSAFDQGSVDTLDHELNQTSLAPISTGIRGLLLIGAIVAALLAVLGTLIQAGILARQRATQFAILRTLGTTSGQIGFILFNEQLFVFVLGLIGGTVLGALLTFATVPLLVYSDSTGNLARVGIPPYQIVASVPGSATFYAVLAAAFFTAIVIAAISAARISLSQTLRISED